VSAYTDVISKSAKTASDTDPFFRPYVSDGSLLWVWRDHRGALVALKGHLLTLIEGRSGVSMRTP
jgi:cytoskeleton-associated protein 5